MSDDDTVELRLAKAYRDEAEQIKKRAEQDRAAAEYERGQADHRLRTVQDTLRADEECKRWLEQHDYAKVRAMFDAAEAKLDEVRSLLSQYSAERHGAARALIEINEREKREQAA
jgi:hypothetical protein